MRETVKKAKRPTEGQLSLTTIPVYRGGGGLARSLPQVSSSKPVFNVYFDGGDSGEYAYGSWEVEFMGFKFGARLVRFGAETNGTRTTSNCSEYLALIAALTWLQSVKDKGKYRVEISGDSKLVVEQMAGRWKCRLPHLQGLRHRAYVLLAGFHSWETKWQPRKHSLSRFGH